MTTKPLFVDLKPGQSISIDGGKTVITLEHKSGQLAKLKIVAAPDVSIALPEKSTIPANRIAMQGISKPVQS